MFRGLRVSEFVCFGLSRHTRLGGLELCFRKRVIVGVGLGCRVPMQGLTGQMWIYVSA